MLTRIEIDGFKTFERFALDLQPLTAIVGPNASGKSNLFDALRFISLLAKQDIRSAMQDLRGEPEELFRQTAKGTTHRMAFAVEVFLASTGTDAFGTTYHIPTQRLRYELVIALTKGDANNPRGIFVQREHCAPIHAKDDRATFLKGKRFSRNSRVAPFIRLSETGDAIEVRQDGRQKHGRPVRYPLREAARTALSTITTAEFPHLNALRDALSDIQFLEINPQAARASNDRFEQSKLRPDASNLAAVLARLKLSTSTPKRPDGVLSDIAADLATLIRSVKRLEVLDDSNQKRYSFRLEFENGMIFSSRVISDGTLRLLALLTILNDPRRRGVLCFEEPENGVHEGRIPALVRFLRNAADFDLDLDDSPFQIIINTHSPQVMEQLEDAEIVVADSVLRLDRSSQQRDSRTRMRTGVTAVGDMFDPERHLTRAEIARILRHEHDNA